MKNAIIYGETHGTRQDREKILNQRFDELDSIFIEGREEDFSWRYRPLYVLFIIGYLIQTRFVNRTVDLAASMFGRLKSSNYNQNLDHDNFDSKLKEAEPELEDSIDANIEKFYRMLGKDRYIAFIIPFTVALLELYINNRYYGLVLLPFSYFALSAIIVNLKGKRDRYMADRISEISEKQNYENTLVICGDAHVEGIKQELIDMGWSVETRRSRHWTRLMDFRNLSRKDFLTDHLFNVLR